MILLGDDAQLPASLGVFGNGTPLGVLNKLDTLPSLSLSPPPAAGSKCDIDLGVPGLEPASGDTGDIPCGVVGEALGYGDVGDTLGCGEPASGEVGNGPDIDARCECELRGVNNVGLGVLPIGVAPPAASGVDGG